MLYHFHITYCRMSEQGESKVGALHLTTVTSRDDEDPRMKLYKQREQEFTEFMIESTQNDSTPGYVSVEDQPLSGLQCLLALTEILDRAAHLRLANFDLEQRIDVLQRFKQIAEV